MDLNAYTKTIGNLFSEKKKYTIPRFQREYSWEKDHMISLWDDILSNISVQDGICKNQEYFIGSLVLIGEEKSFEMQVVDWQQRLTSLVILMSALVETLRHIGKDDLAKGIYENYIEGKDDESKPFFKLVNETPKPFFQQNIQSYEKAPSSESSEEEKILRLCYDEYLKRLSFKEVIRGFKDFDSISWDNMDMKYLSILSSIRDQILHNLKVIYIVVRNEEDAYMIFETLNARGMSLSAVDLIKNDIFRSLKTTHPDDFAKTKWKLIREAFASRNEMIDIDVFFRHFWLSRYGFVSEDKLYRSYKKLEKLKLINQESFLDELVENSKLYNRIVNPLELDWPQQEQKPIYEKLLTFRLFKVTQIRSLLLALLFARNNGKIELGKLISYLEKLESFHFIFTAICSSRASWLESKYSSSAREIRQATDKNTVLAILDRLIADLKWKIPNFETFKEKLLQLDYGEDKPLLQYIFRKQECFLRSTSELRTDFITLEHILSKNAVSTHKNTIGNLIPLDRALNNECEDAELSIKITKYWESELKCVMEFVRDYGKRAIWTDPDIKKRWEDLAKTFYERIWVL